MSNRHLGLINPLLLIKSWGPRQFINANNKYQERLINANKIQLGVILGLILGVPKSAPGLRGSKSATFE